MNELRRTGLALLCAAFCLLSGMAAAGTIEPLRASIVSTDEGGANLQAEFSIELGARLEEAVVRGITLHFLFEVEVSRPRWWWANEALINHHHHYRLSYNTLTQQYRLANGVLHYNVSSVAEALRLLSRIQVPLAEKGILKVGETYAAGVRLSLDRSQLPKPFQIDALSNRDWQMGTRVLRWTHTMQASSPEVRP